MEAETKSNQLNDPDLLTNTNGNEMKVFHICVPGTELKNTAEDSHCNIPHPTKVYRRRWLIKHYYTLYNYLD